LDVQLILDFSPRREHLARMDPRYLLFQVAAGILLAAFIIVTIRLGMNIYRNNEGIRSLFGAVMFFAGLYLGLQVMLVGAGH
jgi:formate/nitrite transporter FocA (FNT family)